MYIEATHKFCLISWGNGIALYSGINITGSGYLSFWANQHLKPLPMSEEFSYLMRRNTPSTTKAENDKTLAFPDILQ